MSGRDGLHLQGAIEAIEKVIDFTKNYHSPTEFYADVKGFDATLMNFVVLGEMVSKLTDQFREDYAYIPWFDIKAFRNIVAYDYFGVDADEVWNIIVEKLPELKSQLEKI